MTPEKKKLDPDPTFKKKLDPTFEKNPDSTSKKKPNFRRNSNLESDTDPNSF